MPPKTRIPKPSSVRLDSARTLRIRISAVSGRRKEKMRNRIKAAQSVDRISSLPDTVLRHILSFLPTKYAACTSILSTRWRYLFPFTHNLDFDDSLMFNPQKNVHSPDAQSEYFMKFVDRYIMLSNVAHIDKFCLKCRQVLDNSRVNSWICAALVRNVRELDLHISTKEPSLLPCCVFTCTTLVVLKLGAGFFLNVPALVYLPCLNSLHLDSIEFPDDISTQRLFSSCPALKDLVITRCSMKNIRVFNPSSPALERLTMDLNNEISSNYKLALDAPRLIYLKYKDCVGEGYTLKNLHSLLEAHIGTHCDLYDYETLEEMFEGINCVQSLHMYGNYGEIFQCGADLPQFDNVTHLKLNDDEGLCVSVLLLLLHRCPNLEELVFKGSLCNECEDRVDEGDANANVPFCMSHHLRAIEFMSIWRSDLRCINYFLRNSQVLETVRIHIPETDQARIIDITKRLLTLPRLSKTCKIEIY